LRGIAAQWAISRSPRVSTKLRDPDHVGHGRQYFQCNTCSSNIGLLAGTDKIRLQNAAMFCASAGDDARKSTATLL
jgi:hypothetical protein